jgi:hypothetical protein
MTDDCYLIVNTNSKISMLGGSEMERLVMDLYYNQTCIKRLVLYTCDVGSRFSISKGQVVNGPANDPPQEGRPLSWS